MAFPCASIFPSIVIIYKTHMLLFTPTSSPSKQLISHVSRSYVFIHPNLTSKLVHENSTTNTECGNALQTTLFRKAWEGNGEARQKVGPLLPKQRTETCGRTDQRMNGRTIQLGVICSSDTVDIVHGGRDWVRGELRSSKSGPCQDVNVWGNIY